MNAPDTTTDTKAALLDHATELIQTRGFCAFSYQDLSERVGIRKASIHHHFPAKADLGVAVITAMAGHVRDDWAALEAAHARVPDRLRSLFAHVREMAAIGDRICPVGALQAEFNALPEPVQLAMRAFDEEYVATYARWLDEGRRAGDLVFPGTPRAMAQVLVTVLQATLQRQRSNPAESVDATLEQLQRLIGL